jgi:outer membrane protein TolC
MMTAVALALVLAQAPEQTPSPASAQQAPQTPAAPQLPPPPQGVTPPPGTLTVPLPPPGQSQPAPSGPIITIAEALRIAAEQNLDLKAADARLKQAQELGWKAWSGYLPQLNAGGNYTRNNLEVSLPFPVYSQVRTRTGAPGTPGNPTDPPQFAPALAGLPSTDFLSSVNQNITIQKANQLAAQVELDQAILAPQLWFLIPNAKRGEKVAALGTETQRRDTLFGVAQAYYGVASLKRAYEISQQLLEIAQRQERDARVRYQAGTIAKVGLLRAEIDRARAEQDLRRAWNSFQSGKISLAVLLNRAPDFETVEPPEPPLSPDTSGLADKALQLRTEVQAARVSVEIARGNRKAVIARYLPNVGAFGKYQIQNITGFTGKYDLWQVGINLQWNLLDGGRRESDIREANAKIDEAEATRLSTEANVRAEVEQALLDLESARANAQKAKEQRDLAAENSRLVEVSYRAGAATAVEQADASTQLRNAEIAAITEALGAQLSAVRVLRSVGEFEPVPGAKK